MSGGDDYELVFTCHPSNHQRVMALGEACATPVTRIGRITSDLRTHLLTEDGIVLPNTFSSFDHFA
jgi:thiamine-monophosphate kinase